MKIDRNGLLVGADYRPSPNCNERPDAEDISLLVVHGISLPPREFGSEHICALFHNCLDVHAHPYFQQLAGLEVSAHLLVQRDGALIQFVPFHQRAWHAGQSSFQGRAQCNDYSIGIELEGHDEVPYTAAQYHQLASLIRVCQRRWPGITAERIVGHCDIAPGRKTDPGPAFDWGHLRTLLE